MNAKKNPRQDLEGKRATIFTVGLLAAGSFTLAAFTYTSPLAVEEAKIAAEHSEVNYFVEEQPKEQPKEVVEIKQQPEDTPQESTTELNSEASEEINRKESSNEKVESGVVSEKLPFKHGEHEVIIKVKEVKKEVIDFPDEEAEWIGGQAEMFKFIANEQEYPDEAIDIGAEGKVYVNFVVETDGSISSISVQGNADRSLKAEARRIVKAFPKWKPGTVDGFNVRTRVRLPINFVLAR